MNRNIGGDALAQLQQMATACMYTDGIRDTISTLLPCVRDITGSSAVTLAIGDGETIQCHATTADGTRQSSIARDSASPLARAIATRRPAWTGAAKPPGAMAVVPFERFGTGEAGALGVAFDEAQVFGAHERSFLMLVATLASQALERAVLADEVTARARQSATINAITRAAAAAATETELAHAVLTEATSALGANASLLAVRQDGDLVVRAAMGVTSRARGRRFVIDELLPFGTVVTSATPVFLGDRAQAWRAYPRLEALIGETAPEAWAVLPLNTGFACVGAIGFGFDEPRRFEETEQAMLLEIASGAARALERAQLFDAERAAAQRLAFLLRASAQISRSILDYETALRTLAEATVPAIADWCAVDVRSSSDELRRVVVVHADPAKAAAADQLGERWRELPIEARLAIGSDVVLTRRTRLMASTEEVLASITEPELRSLIVDLGFHSLLVVPLATRDHALGTMTLVMADARRQFSAHDVELVEDLASRASFTIANATAYQQERHQSETLQHHLLPDRVPSIPGIETAVHYQAGAQGMDVGGDWYDVIEVGDGTVGVVVGDVVGRGPAAAAFMGQLRSALRAFCLVDPDPATVLGRLNQFARQLRSPRMTSVFYGHYCPESRRLLYAIAGHPPPIVLSLDGRADHLDGPVGPPLGVDRFSTYTSADIGLSAGDTLIAFTDGLFERRDTPLDVSLKALLRSVENHSDWDVDALVGHVATEAHGPSNDDAAILALRPAVMENRPLHVRIEALRSSLLPARRALREWLQAQRSPDREYVDDLLLAAGEALANAVEHAYGPAGGPVELDASAAGGTMTITVRDYGRWRAPRGKNRGRGTAMMHALVDDVTTTRTSNGTTLTLRRVIERDGGNP